MVGAIELGPTGTTFPNVIGITLPLSKPLEAGRALPVMRLDPQTGGASRAALRKGQPIFAFVSSDGKSAIFGTDHFSQYLVVDDSKIRMKNHWEFSEGGKNIRIYYPNTVVPEVIFQSFGVPLLPGSEGLDSSTYRKQRYKEVLKALFFQSEVNSARAVSLVDRVVDGLSFAEQVTSAGGNTLQVASLNQDFIDVRDGGHSNSFPLNT